MDAYIENFRGPWNKGKLVGQKLPLMRIPAARDR